LIKTGLLETLDDVNIRSEDGLDDVIGITTLVDCNQIWLLGEGPPLLFELRGGEVALMEDEAITLLKGRSVLEGEVAAPFELLVPVGAGTKGVCGEEAVVAGVPPGRVAEVLGMIEDRNDSRRLSRVRSVKGHPLRTLPPSGIIGHALAVGDVALGNFPFKPQGRGHADRNAPFLGIAAVLGEESSIDLDFEIGPVLRHLDFGMERQNTGSEKGGVEESHDVGYGKRSFSFHLGSKWQHNAVPFSN